MRWPPPAWPTSGSRAAWCLWKPAARCSPTQNAGRACSSVCNPAGKAPRAALLCFDAETFTRAGSADALTAAARTLQARLGEISQRFGISFPVYVLFTKMNRVAFFEDFVRNLSNQEAGQVLGATLPMAQPGATGIYAEVETRRLSAAFDGLFYSLADRRIVFLPRENDPQKVPGAYEFPREFRKLRNGLVQFLVDVCRPSQLRASPFLRGFYFSGVRPVVVHDTPVEAPRRIRAAVAFRGRRRRHGHLPDGLSRAGRRRAAGANRGALWARRPQSAAMGFSGPPVQRHHPAR